MNCVKLFYLNGGLIVKKLFMYELRHVIWNLGECNRRK
jgi:hypothetical protein